MENKIEYKELFKRISSCVSIYEATDNGNDFIFKDLDKATEKTEKIKRKDVIGKSVLKVFPGVKDFGLFDVFKRVYKTGKSENHSISFYKDNRISGWRENFVYRLPNGNVVAVYNDLTNRKKAEEELFLANERLSLAQKSACAGVWDWDMNTEKLNWTPEFYILFGLDPKKDTSTFDTWRRVLHPDDRQMAEKKINESIKDQKPLFNEYRIVMPSGEIRWINALGNTIYDENGKAVRMSGICIDITDHKHLEEALRTSEEKFAKAFHSSPQGLTITTLDDNKIIEVNNAYIDIFGFSREEAIGHTSVKMGNWVSPEDRAGIVNLLKEKGFVHNKEVEVRTKSGDIITLILSAELLNVEGKVHMLSTFYNITDRKKIEEALHKSENLLSKIFDILPVGLWIADKNGKLTRSNQKGREIWGAEPLVGQDNYSVFKARRLPSGEEIAPDDWALAHTINSGETILDEMLEIDGFNGKKKIILNYTSPVLDEDGKVEAGVIVNLDITEQKIIQDALAESEEKYRTLVEKINEAILILQDGNFVFANSRTYDLMGIQDESFVGKSFIDFVWPEDREIVIANYAKRIDGEILSDAYDFRIIGPDGGPVWVFMSVTLIQYKGRPATLIMVTNITDRKKAEQKILHLSFHDQLTGLYNRRFFEEELKRLNTKRQLPLSFIMGDLNGLKLINDVFGHNEGDNLLVKTAEILKKVCRSDDILARWGGDEFVILLPKTTSADSEDIVERIKKGCKKTVKQKIPLSLSLGAATKEMSVQDIQAVIIDAESNMYRNKLAKKESISSSVIFALEQALYEKSNETKAHIDRVRDFALKLGKSVKLHASQLDEISLLASLHDIGKVAISESILAKEGKLTKQEWEVIKRHPEIGFNIASSSPQIAHIAKAILACHENFNGSGYPLGIAGESIPIISRIILICDAYDVMTRGRIYKDPMSKDDAIRELKRCAGSQFDPVLVDKFIEIISN